MKDETMIQWSKQQDPDTWGDSEAAPGPWTQYDVGRSYIVIRDAAGDMVTAIHRTAYEARDRDIAAKIEAAPDLLEALRGLLEETADVEAGAYHAGALKARHRAVRAIAKAEGRAES